MTLFWEKIFYLLFNMALLENLAQKPDKKAFFLDSHSISNQNCLTFVNRSDHPTPTGNFKLFNIF
jgi:hypothetical protein